MDLVKIKCLINFFACTSQGNLFTQAHATQLMKEEKINFPSLLTLHTGKMERVF